MTGPDYSSITTSSDIRWVTFKYSSVITSGEYERLRLTLTHSGLTVDFTAFGAANHYVYLRVADSAGTGSWETDGWLDATNTVSALGVQTGADGTYCINGATSTASQRDCYIVAGTSSTAVVYVRVGIPGTLAASLTTVSVAAMSTFT